MTQSAASTANGIRGYLVEGSRYPHHEPQPVRAAIADSPTAKETHGMEHVATASDSNSTELQVLLVFIAFIATVAYLGLLVRRLVFPLDSSVPSGSPLELRLKAIEFERDRVGAVAKGLAGASGGFLVALLFALIKDEISDQLSFPALLGTLAGSVGLLTLAACLSRLLARHVSSALGGIVPSNEPLP